MFFLIILKPKSYSNACGGAGFLPLIMTRNIFYELINFNIKRIINYRVNSARAVANEAGKFILVATCC